MWLRGIHNADIRRSSRVNHYASNLRGGFSNSEGWESPAPTKRWYSSGFPELACSSSTVAEAGDHSGMRRCAASIARRREWQSHRGWNRVSRVRTLPRVFRSRWFRIRELLRKQSDRRGGLIGPWHRPPAAPSVRQHAIDCCSRDMRSLCRRRPHMPPADVESFAEAWVWGGCWISRSMGN